MILENGERAYLVRIDWCLSWLMDKVGPEIASVREYQEHAHPEPKLGNNASFW